MIQEDKALWKYIIFGILTCGIYDFYFIYKMAQDANTMCEGDGKKTSGLVVFILLSCLTCGIYALIWNYSLANRLASNAPRYGLSFQENGNTVLLWNIFGSLLCGVGAFIAMNILIKNMNEMARVYNSRSGAVGSRPNGGEQSAAMEQEHYQIPQQNQYPMQQIPQQNQYQAQQMYQQSSYAEKDTTVLSMNQMQVQQVSQQKAILYFVHTQQSITIDKDEFKIGKNPSMSDYVINNNTSVSRQHAVIQRRNGQFYVTDLESTNGTFVNEKRISGTVQLQDGDNIRYADVISVFNIMR